MSPIRVDKDLLPTTVFAIHLTRLNQPAGWLAGEFSLEEMWRMVDRHPASANTASRWSSRPTATSSPTAIPTKRRSSRCSRNMSAHPLVPSAPRRIAGRCPGIGRVPGRGRPAAARRRRAYRAARLDRDRRAADHRGVRQRDPAPASARRRDLVALLGMIAVGYFFGPPVPDADSRAAARHPRSGRRPARHARRHPDRRRVRRSRRRLQHDGRSPRRAAGERQAPGAAGDVRPHRRRASCTTSRIRFRTSATARACSCATTSTKSRASRSASRSSASSRRSSGSWTTSATS